MLPIIQLALKKHLANTKAMAFDSVHGIAFHRGLGNPVGPTSTNYAKYLDTDLIADFAQTVYTKPNFAVVANGAEHEEVSKWVNQFFTDVSSGSSPIESQQTKYYGGEERISHASGNTMILAFPGSSSFTGGFYKPEISVLASLLGGQSHVKWSPGFSLLSKASQNFPAAHVDTKSVIYSDAGLLTVTIHGAAKDVSGAAHEAVKTIQKIAGGEISKEDISKAKAAAKFKELEYGQNIWAGIELTGAGLVHGGKAYQLDETAKLIDAVTEEKVKAVSFPGRSSDDCWILMHDN